MTLTYKNRALYGRNCYAAQKADRLAKKEKKGAFQQNTTHDIISNLGGKSCFYHSNHVTHMSTSKSNRAEETRL